MEKKYFVFMILILLSTSFSCDLLTGPGGDVQPGRRDYVWTVDTLRMQIGSLNAIWGSSPSNVWLGGYDDMFHYDGSKFTRVSVSFIGINTICGFDSNDVWAGSGGNGNEIWHFDGNGWKRNFVYAAGNSEILNIHGLQNNDIYGVGLDWAGPLDNLGHRGFVLHFDGRSWRQVYRANCYSQFFYVRAAQGCAYIADVQNGYTHRDVYTVYQFKSGIMERMYSDSVGLPYVTTIGEQVYFIISRDVCRYVSGNFIKVFSIDAEQYGYNVWGRSEKDVFVYMNDGIAHWNGTDLQYLFHYPNGFAQYYGDCAPAIFDNDVLFSAHDRTSNIELVYHGRLLDEKGSPAK